MDAIKSIANWLIHTLAGRMLLAVLAIHLVLVSLLFMQLLLTVEQTYKRQFVDQVRADAQWVSGYLAREWKNEHLDIQQLIFEDLLMSGFRTSVDIIDTEGRHLTAANNPNTGWPEMFQEDFFFGEHGDAEYHIATAITYAAGSKQGNIRLTYDEGLTQDEIKSLYTRGITLAATYLFVMLIATGLLGYYLTRSLRRLGAAAHRVAEGQFDKRFEVKADVREVAQLAEDLESMRCELVAQGQKLSDREKRMRTILENVADAIITFDENGLIESCNSATLEIFGYDVKTLIGKNIRTLLDEKKEPFDVDRMICVGSQETIGVRRDGSRVSIEATISEFWQSDRRLLLGVLRDISERKRAEEEHSRHRSELAHAGRLSSLGEMSAGLAHELNQPLAAVNMYIQGSLSRCKNQPGSCGDVVKALEAASTQAQRAGEIIRRIRGFARKDATLRSEEDINKLVRQTVNLVDIDSRQATLNTRFNLADHLPPVEVDAMQIKQVLVNLIRNALEAMIVIAPEKRELLISTSRTENDLVQVVVEDRGEGIAKDVVDRIFEPFFTTKSYGVGLGLPISESIIEEHGGRLWITPRSGGGTCFSFTLPTYQKETP